MAAVTEDQRRQQFARLRFKGRRYTGPEFPVEMLPELAAYRELVVTAARALYFSDHPGRKRVPRGFDASFGLVLSHIEEGSSVPVLARVLTPPAAAAAMLLPLAGVSPAAEANYFDRARDLVEEAVRCIAQQRALPKELSPNLGAKFGMFGRSLGPDETIFLSKPSERRDDAPYNAVARKEIMLSLRHEYWEDVTIIGEITKADRRRLEFEVLNYENDQPTPFRLRHSSQFQDLVEWLRDRPLVAVSGRALYRHGGTLRELEVDTVSLVEEDLGDVPQTEATMPIADQLDSIARLPTGWLDGHGDAYDRSAIGRVRDCLERLIAEHRLPNPFVYPTPETEVRVEWPSVKWDVVITFDRSAASVWLYATAVEGDDEIDERFSMGRSRDMTKLGIELETLLRGQTA